MTILVSSILLGSAGLWLASGKSKGAIVGAAAGAAIATGYVYHDISLKKLASRQQQLSTSYDALAKRSKDSRRAFRQSLNGYQAALNDFEGRLQSRSR
ncbi:MAG: hypothetical protein WBA10_14675, partial [Elainellaceae cyanobacterium]